MYEWGALVAAVLWFISACTLFMTLNSWAESNLRKVGMRHSWVTLKAKPLSQDAQQRGFLKNALKFLLIQAFGLIGIFFSWGYVILCVANFSYTQLKDRGAPPSVKEFRWKMRNLNLSTDEILAGMALISGSKVPLDKLRADLHSDLDERGLMILK